MWTSSLGCLEPNRRKNTLKVRSVFRFASVGVRVALDGRLVSQLELTKSSAGLPADIPQAEGVATDEAGNLYIVSEPNMLYTFTRGDRAPI